MKTFVFEDSPGVFKTVTVNDWWYSVTRDCNSLQESFMPDDVKFVGTEDQCAEWIAERDKENPAQDITIPRKEYEELKDDSLFLTCLLDGGVDNWDWYGEAIVDYEARKKKI